MTQERGMTIHFMDGTQMRVSFPKQVEDDETIPVRLERVLETQILMLEADGALLAVPFGSIKYLQVYPAPPVLPDYVIKEASIA